MAEARQAVAFQFAVTEEGVKIQFDQEAVKSAVKALVGFGWTRYLRARNAVLNGLFPASPLSLAVVGGAVGVSAVTGRDPTFGLNQAIANLLGYVIYTSLCVYSVNSPHCHVVRVHHHFLMLGLISP